MFPNCALTNRVGRHTVRLRLSVNYNTFAKSNCVSCAPKSHHFHCSSSTTPLCSFCETAAQFRLYIGCCFLSCAEGLTMKCTTIHNIYASTMMLLVGVDIFRTSSVWQRLGSIHLVGLHTHKFPNFRPTYPPRTQKIMTSLWQKYIGICIALDPPPPHFGQYVLHVCSLIMRMNPTFPAIFPSWLLFPITYVLPACRWSTRQSHDRTTGSMMSRFFRTTDSIYS